MVLSFEEENIHLSLGEMATDKTKSECPLTALIRGECPFLGSKLQIRTDLSSDPEIKNSSDRFENSVQ